jgi:hypothetical protein
MLAETLTTLFTRDLHKLMTEIESYQNEANIWRIEKSISNAAGNLCLHLIGNLNTYIGAVLGNTGYIRNRDAEFSLKDVPRMELMEKIEATIDLVTKVIPTISAEQFNSEYPLLVLKEKTSTQFFLVHLTTHLAYHLGQINYHRRLMDQS